MSLPIMGTGWLHNGQPALISLVLPPWYPDTSTVCTAGHLAYVTEGKDSVHFTTPML